jgi:hypothetical protein
MKIQIEVPEYSPETGIRFLWEPGSNILVTIHGDVVELKANKEGLLSFARHLMTLAQESVPVDSHVHFDSSNAFEEGSCQVMVEKRVWECALKGQTPWAFLLRDVTHSKRCWRRRELRPWPVTCVTTMFLFSLSP